MRRCAAESPHVDFDRLCSLNMTQIHAVVCCVLCVARSLNWLPIVNFMGVVKLLWPGTVSDRADKLSVFPTHWTTLYPNGF